MSHEKRRILTGITTSGTPHLGNYVGAIRPAIAASRSDDAESFYFLADYHALIKTGDPARVQQSTLEIAASWIACGLDPEQVFFYRQSDIPEIPELTWLLTCVTAKGLLNRAHAYKAAVDANSAAGEDADAGVTAGLYMYPVLMAADILLFNAHEVPVGRDQIQHIEMARDIGQRFNHLYGNLEPRATFFTLPEAKIEDNVATLPGTDGRKMSKSYDNTIPLWLPAQALRKAILGIVTDSRAPGEEKDPDTSNIFAIYQAFATPAETAAMRRAFSGGIGWGEAKQELFERVDAELAPMRDRYDALVADPALIEALLNVGAQKTRERSQGLMKRLRQAVGIRTLASSPTPSILTADVLFQQAYERIAGADEVLELEVKGPWEDGGKIGLTINYSKKGSFIADGFSSKREAGLTKKRLEAGDGIAVEIAPNSTGLFALSLTLDDNWIGRGIATQHQDDAEQERDKFWKSVSLRKQQNTRDDE